jgi:ABC-type glycerol-3-phosphate transport system substrate-binding protein
MKGKMKKALVIFASALLVLSMTSCMAGSTKTNSSSSSINKGTMTGNLRVTGQSWFFGKYDFNTAKSDFEAKHPGVTVTYSQIPSSDTATNMLQWSAGTTTCDMTLGGGKEDVDEYAAKGFLVPFDDSFFTGTGFTKSDYEPAWLALGNINGTQYLIPVCNEVLAVVVNKKMLAAAGLLDSSGNIIPATTWDQLYNYAQKLTIKSGTQTTQTGLSIDWGINFASYTYMACLQGEKGTIYGSDKKTLDFTSSQASDVFTVWAKLVSNGLSPIDTFADQDAGRTNFKAGKVAMLISAASRWMEASGILGAANVGVMPIPGTDKNGSLAYTQGVCIPKFSPKIALAQAFVKEELLSTNFLQSAMLKFGKMPPLKSFYANLQNPSWPTVEKISSSAVSSPVYMGYNQLDTEFQVELQNYLRGKQTLAATQSHMTLIESQLNLTTGLK